MLRTNKGDNIYFITQPDHAAVSGYFAAHWGNDEFTKPGYYAPSADEEKLRAETVLGIAEHDNGWWEWEATLGEDAEDGLPEGLSTFINNQEQGLRRWRLGIPRLSAKHPYASLLISYHAYWLYAYTSGVENTDAFVHPLFSKVDDINARKSKLGLEGQRLENVLKFLEEVRGIQNGFKTAVDKDEKQNGWLSEGNLMPHIRLIQILDALSLYLCSDLIPAREGESKGLGQDEIELFHVPGKSWDDRVTIDLTPKGDGKIRLSPYPFDIEPLGVAIPARIIEGPIDSPIREHQSWHAIPKQIIQYEFSSA